MNKFTLTNQKKLAVKDRKPLDRNVENAHLADECVRLALMVFADQDEAKVLAEEILRDLRALPKPLVFKSYPVKVVIGDISPEQRARFQAVQDGTAFGSLANRMKGIRAAIASPKTPAHLKAGLATYLTQLEESQ